MPRLSRYARRWRRDQWTISHELKGLVVNFSGEDGLRKSRTFKVNPDAAERMQQRLPWRLAVPLIGLMALVLWVIIIRIVLKLL
jgi:hypothetical protein